MTLFELLTKQIKNGESLFIKKIKTGRDDYEVHFIAEAKNGMKNSFGISDDSICDCPSAIEILLDKTFEASRKGIELNS